MYFYSIFHAVSDVFRTSLLVPLLELGMTLGGIIFMNRLLSVQHTRLALFARCIIAQVWFTSINILSNRVRVVHFPNHACSPFILEWGGGGKSYYSPSGTIALHATVDYDINCL